MAITGELQQYQTGLPSPVWVFDGTAALSMYSAYTVSNAAGVALPCINFTGATLPLYYAGAGTVTFTIQGGDGSSMNGSDAYVGPDLDSWDFTTGHWTIFEAGGLSSLRLGSRGQPGITFAVDVTLPDDAYGDGAGQIFFCQLLTKTTFDYQGPESRRVLVEVANPLLDGGFPYEGLTMSGAADAAVQLRTNDNPSMPLPPANCYSARIVLQFTTYLMYQSSSDLGAIPVAMAYRSWSTMVIALVSATTGAWEILEQDGVFVTPTAEEYSLPQWLGNTSTLAANLQAQLQSEFGGNVAEVVF